MRQTAAKAFRRLIESSNQLAELAL